VVVIKWWGHKVPSLGCSNSRRPRYGFIIIIIIIIIINVGALARLQTLTCVCVCLCVCVCVCVLQDASTARYAAACLKNLNIAAAAR